MDDRIMTLRIPDPLWRAAADRARRDDVGIADLIRQALAIWVQSDRGGPADAVATIRRALATDFAQAATWAGVQARLRARHLVLRRRQDAIWLCTWPLERPVLPLSRLGTSEEELTLLYRAPFPAHGIGDPPASRLDRVKARMAETPVPRRPHAA